MTLPTEQLNALTEAVAELDEARVQQVLDALLAADPGQAELATVVQHWQAGMNEVGRRFEANDYFLAELVFAGEIARQLMERVGPLLQAGPGRSLGSVVLGTARGDIHDIGKDIAKTMLLAAGFEVHDLGVDVAPARFADKAKETAAQIVGISGLLTLSAETMRETVAALEAAGVRGQVKVIIGGNLVDAVVCQRVGADGFTRSAVEGVNICKAWVGA
jgi:methanogenic corrinoid protein MtbC1